MSKPSRAMKKSEASLKEYKRIAVMGGTFDPIHHGHLVAAAEVRSEFSIEQVVFIPTGIPPHKKSVSVTDPERRYEMTALATANNRYFSVSRMEIDRPGETYTIDTIRELRANCRPDVEIFFITGADAVHQILSWRDSEELLKLCSFVAVTRPGYAVGELRREVERLNGHFASRLHFLEVPALAISSTDIRGRVRADKPVSYLLPDAVERYIEKNKLYKPTDLERMKAALREKLSDKRYNHTLGVLEEALALARLYGVSEEKAATAALLHDYAKELPQEQKFELCESFGIEQDEIMRNNIDLAHSFLSARLARQEFGVEDENILNAIAFHTTARKKMSKLEKIIFIADLTERSREPDYGVDEVRGLAKISLNQAVLAGLRVKLMYTRGKNKQVHPLSVEALKYYKKQ